MPQPLSNVVIHLVFSTLQREPFISGNIKTALHAYLATLARDQGWECYRIGGGSDHVHLALRQPRTHNLSDLVGHIKRTSTAWIKQQGEDHQNFHWQKGYGAFSVSPQHLPSLISYIENQEAHHLKISFQDEFRGFLKKYNIDYDEKYVWD
jgi:putative transposase